MIIYDKKPQLFQKTACNIWTDPYIQQQMLKEHLNPLSDGASRREETILKIVRFISSHAKPGGNLLDLGCGPGLYTSCLKDKGLQVTGIDFNRASIEYASAKREDVKYICGDYIRDYPAGKYDTAIMIYCDMGTHSDTDRNRVLKNIYSSLNESGVLIFDVFTENLIYDKSENKSWEYAPEGGFWSEKEYLLLSQIFYYPDNKAFASQYNLLSGNTNKHFIVWDRYYSETEITEILKSVGFRKIEIYHHLLGDNNFTSDSEMFIVATK